MQAIAWEPKKYCQGFGNASIAWERKALARECKRIEKDAKVLKGNAKVPQKMLKESMGTTYEKLFYVG